MPPPVHMQLTLHSRGPRKLFNPLLQQAFDRGLGAENRRWAHRSISAYQCNDGLLFDCDANVSVMKNMDLFGSLLTDGSGKTTSVTGINKGMLELRPGGKLRGPFSSIDAKYCPGPVPTFTAKLMCWITTGSSFGTRGCPLSDTRW